MTREEREDAIDIIQSILDKYEEDECLVTEITIGDGDIKAFRMAIKALEQEPKTGHWEWLRCDMYVCSECKNVYTDLSGIKDGMNYCPNCGSRNEVEE